MQCRLLVLVVLSSWAVMSPQASAQSLDAVNRLFEWVRALGGQVKAEVKINQDGIRGLFATEHVKEGDYITSVPAAAIINAGGLQDSFAVPTLTVLRELKDPHSRFKPYIDVFPTPSEVLNSCNMDMKYVGMWKSEYWEKNVKDWQGYLESLLSGRMNPDIEITIEEAVGNATVTLADLEYACAISSTRYLSAARRKRLIMAPVFDLANHHRECAHSINQYEASDFLHIIAGADVQPGDEICYSYGSLRDDYAVAHYGFLPALEDPPRLSLVDHPQFQPDEAYSHDEPPSEEPFEEHRHRFGVMNPSRRWLYGPAGTGDELHAELLRLRAVYDKLKATPDPLPPQPKGTDYVYDVLKELEERRLNALVYEMKRISGLLDIRFEL